MWFQKVVCSAVSEHRGTWSTCGLFFVKLCVLGLMMGNQIIINATWFHEEVCHTCISLGGLITSLICIGLVWVVQYDLGSNRGPVIIEVDSNSWLLIGPLCRRAASSASRWSQFHCTPHICAPRVNPTHRSSACSTALTAAQRSNTLLRNAATHCCATQHHTAAQRSITLLRVLCCLATCDPRDPPAVTGCSGEQQRRSSARSLIGPFAQQLASVVLNSLDPHRFPLDFSFFPP